MRVRACVRARVRMCVCERARVCVPRPAARAPQRGVLGGREPAVRRHPPHQPAQRAAGRPGGDAGHTRLFARPPCLCLKTQRWAIHACKYTQQHSKHTSERAYTHYRDFLPKSGPARMPDTLVCSGHCSDPSIRPRTPFEAVEWCAHWGIARARSPGPGLDGATTAPVMAVTALYTPVTVPFLPVIDQSPGTRHAQPGRAAAAARADAACEAGGAAGAQPLGLRNMSWLATARAVTPHRTMKRYGHEKQPKTLLRESSSSLKRDPAGHGARGHAAEPRRGPTWPFRAETRVRCGAGPARAAARSGDTGHAGPGTR